VRRRPSPSAARSCRTAGGVYRLRVWIRHGCQRAPRTADLWARCWTPAVEGWTPLGIGDRAKGLAVPRCGQGVAASQRARGCRALRPRGPRSVSTAAESAAADRRLHGPVHVVMDPFDGHALSSGPSAIRVTQRVTLAVWAPKGAQGWVVARGGGGCLDRPCPRIVS